jgi:hypothetical protein
MIQREESEQIALFQWAAMMESKYPELRLLHAIPNGGHRHKATAARLKAAGVKAGVPDICLPVARGDWHGLYIELKVGKNKLTEAQRRWKDDLIRYGYLALVCYGWEEARDVIEWYLGLEIKEADNG